MKSTAYLQHNYLQRKDLKMFTY